MRSFEDWYAESKLELNCFQNHLEKQWFVSNVAAGYKAGQESRQTEVDALQKRVDAVKQLIQVYKDEEKELELKEWEQSTIYGRIAI
uniref:hypothetical protein n=1 Tax=Acinetobacter higginsii TaxID=70347 RepID=UPI00300A6890